MKLDPHVHTWHSGYSTIPPLDHGRMLLDRPWRWRRQLMAACLLAGAPLVTIPLVLSALHFVLEARCNRSLLQDIARRPALRMPEWA